MSISIGMGSNNYTLSEDWAKKFNNKVSDKVLDKKEIEELKNGATQDEKDYLDAVIGDLNDGDTITTQKFTKDGDGIEPKSFAFKVYKYDEKDVIPGKTNAEIVANIGQGDHMDSTKTDDYRCGAACIVNSVILAEGKEGFQKLAEKLGLGKDLPLTYENVHLVQDKLIEKAKAGKNGMAVTFDLSTGKVNGGTFVDGIKAAGKEVVPLEIKDGSRKDSIDTFFKDNPKGTVIVNCSRGPGEDDIKFSEGNGPKGSQNHWVTLTKEGNPPKYYISDSFATNGTGKNRRELSDSEVAEIMSSKRPNFGVKLNPPAETPATPKPAASETPATPKPGAAAVTDTPATPKPAAENVNMEVVSKKAEEIKSLMKGYTNSDEEQKIKKILLDASPAELDAILKKVNISDLADELDDDDFADVMKKVAANSGVGDNAKHLLEMAKASDDDVAMEFLKRMSDDQLKKLANDPNGKATLQQLWKNLDSGWTTGDEEKQMDRLKNITG